MQAILNWQKRLRQLAKVQKKDLIAIIKRHEQAILDLNREQLMSGLKADGKSLGKYKSKNYAIMKELFNPKKVVDLRLTGDLHNEMFIGEKNGNLFIDSSDEKRNDLVKKYGKIFGLTERSQKLAVNKIIKADIKKYYEQRMGI